MVYVVMGVAGCGKTTIGMMLAGHLGVPFHDADAYHPKANVEKMARGIPLDDDDRMPWLQTLAREIGLWNRERGAVLACSALKQSYRDVLIDGNTGKLLFIYLKGDKRTISTRLQGRSGHFFPLQLLDSQIMTLEEPGDAVTVKIDKEPEEVVDEIINLLDRKGYIDAR
jgi:carbohydrate kinase (thermoresistant glucokinase family)